MIKLKATAFLIALCVAQTVNAAGAPDATIKTDHPQYPGEGAFQTVEDCVRFATRGKSSEQDKAIALYLWMLTHQWHLASPQEWNIPGETPNTANWRDDMIVYDANRARFSYGYGLCGTVHSWNEPYWRSLGMAVRRRAFPGHVNSEVQYGGSWHAFDTDMAGLLFRKDGQVAGYDDIIADTSIVKKADSPIPCYPFAWPSDFNSMKKGWQEVARSGKWYKLYNSGYSAHPAIVNLRPGETFTRWFDPDHFGGKSKRRFWHNQPGGPFRNWTFANQGEPEHRGDKSNSRGNASYCNGEFVFRPDLSTDAYQDALFASSANVARADSSPQLRSGDGKPAFVIFEHFSPYVICGDPVDDANPMTGKATDGFIVAGQASGKVNLELSTDQGQRWIDLGAIEGEFHRDITELVKGRYGWRMRLSWQANAGLDELSFTTTTQISQAIYPRLSNDGCDVTYRNGMRGVTPVLPNFGLDEQGIAAVEVQEMRSDNVAYQPRSGKNRLVYRTTNNKPGHVVFRVDSPHGDLLTVNAAARCQIRTPPPEGCDFHLDVSTDNGKSWRGMARATVPKDNEFSSGWVYGEADVADAKTRHALVRVHFYQDGYTTGMIDSHIYGVHRLNASGGGKLTYGWKENGQSKTHVEQLPADSDKHQFHVPTGKQIVDEFVRIELP